MIDAAVTISGTSLRRTDVGSFSKKRNKKHERGRDGGGARGKRRHADIADTASRSNLPGRGWVGAAARGVARTACFPDPSNCETSVSVASRLTIKRY